MPALAPWESFIMEKKRKTECAVLLFIGDRMAAESTQPCGLILIL